MTQQAERQRLTKLWREYGWGRLYWRNQHPTWRVWDRDDIAVARDGVVAMHFTSIEGLRAVIDEVRQNG